MHVLSKSLIVVVAWMACGCGAQEQKAQPQQLEVSVVEIKKEDVVIFTDFVGTINGIENADIRARVAGYLEEVHFTEGSRVKKGDLLFTIDPVLSEAEVRKAQGDLAMAQADLVRAKADVDRLTPLVASNAVSQQELDHASAAKQSAEAQIQAARGDLATAQASLGYTKVRAPIDGIVGVRNVSIGTLVGQGEPTLLTTISQLDTVRVRFPISEQLYLKHAALLNSLVVDHESKRGRLDLILADGSTYAHEGWVALLDRAISASTGSIMLEARFPNPKGLLRPGQFARVRAPTSRIEGAMGVLQRAVIERQSLYELLVLGEGNKVERKPVTVGEKVNSFWLIEKGVQPGDKVLIEGVQKVKAGMVVVPKVVPQKPISPPKKPLQTEKVPPTQAPLPGAEQDPSRAPASKKTEVPDTTPAGPEAPKDASTPTENSQGSN